MFCTWKLGIMALQFCSSILALMALITGYWGIIPSAQVHFGLFSYCSEAKGCLAIAGTGDVIRLLIATLIIGLAVAFPCNIVELRMNYGCLSCMGGLSFLIAILGFAAMVHSAVMFSVIFANSSYYYSWSFALGWLSVVTAIISGALSFYIWKKEPTNAESRGNR